MTQPRDIPFDKRVSDLEPEDLEGLTQVHEGWYVEYKEQPISLRNMAKSLSAFANQYGGWLFLGVSENPSANTAGGFPGVPSSSVSRELEMIRNASKDLLRPSVFFDYKVIDGPVQLIGLPLDQSVIAVYIPQGPDTPYVHNDGRIYRRIADSSDPVPITDRAELDLLSQRREEALARLDRRVQRSPITSQAEENMPYLQMHIFSDPYEILGHRYQGDFQQFAHAMKEPMLPFDNLFFSHEGYVARQVGNNDAYLRTFTWEFSRHCHSLVSVPINVYDVRSFRTGKLGSSTAEHFLRLVGQSGIEPVRVLDLTRMLELVWAVSLRHRRLADQSGISGPFYVKCILENVWRTIPFVNTGDYINHINEFGLPLVQDSSVFVPEGRTLDSFIRLDEYADEIKEDWPMAENPISSIDTALIANRILPAFGVSIELALNARHRRGEEFTP